MQKDHITSRVTVSCLTTEGMSYHFTEVQQTSTLNPTSATLSCKRETVTGTNELNLKDKPPGIMRLVVKRVLPANQAAHAGRGKDPVLEYFGGLEYSPLNTQASSELAKVEEEIVEQINKARSRPEEFGSEVLLPKLNRVTRTLVPSADGHWSKSREGADGLAEAIAFSKSAAKEVERKSDGTPSDYRPTLTISPGLSLAARDHALDLGFHSLSSHRGSDQSTLQDRVGRYIDLKQGCWVTELLCFAASSPFDVVAQLFVNDGDSKRTQRSLLLHEKASYIGVALVPHRSTEYCCVVVLASKPIFELGPDTQLANHRDFWQKRLVVPENEAGQSTQSPANGATCDRCRVEVDDRSTVYGPLGKRYHRQCLICRVCKSSFTHSFYCSPDNEVYCGDCMKFRQCLRCFSCNAKLQSQPIHRVNDKPACQSCFTEKTALVLNSCQLRTD
jgi:uncharacterized protein YkwD